MATIELSILDDQISAVRDRLTAEHKRLSEIQECVTKDEARLDALTEFRQLVADNDQPKKRLRLTPLTPPEENPPRKLKASATIVELLGEHPGGMARADIIATVAPRMDSNAANPTHIIRTTLFNMKRSGRLEYDEKTEMYRLPKK